MQTYRSKKLNICLKEIRQVREKINRHLDIIEKKLEEDVSVLCTQFETKTQSLRDEIEAKIQNIHQIEDDFATTKMYGTNLQVFSALKGYEKMTEVEFNFLHNIQGEGELQKVKFDIDSSLTLKICDLKSFGNVEVSNVESSGFLDTEKAVQIPKSSLKIVDIHPKLIKEIQVQPKNRGDIRNCLICPNGQKVFVDQSNNRLVRFSKDNNFIDNISLTYMPRDICYFGNGSIAISFHSKKLISVLELESQKILKSLKVSYRCYGIDMYQQHLYVCFANEGKIGILDCDGTLVSLISVHGTNTAEITVSKNRIYGANWTLNTVSCYATNGVLLWTYKHDDIREPRGLSIDDNSFVYVACHESNNVVVISPDGQNSKVILKGKQDINEPIALHVNKELSLLLVGNSKNGRALLYQL